VQDHLQAALARFADAPIEVVAAGRTDAGVHASAQVVHFDAGVQRHDYSWVRGTNTFLDERVRVLWAHGVPQGFHARYSARARTYRYVLLNDSVAPGLWQGKVGWYHRPLDVEVMALAARQLEGEHDFSAFRDAQCQAKTPVRTMGEARVEREANLVVFTFRANAFLHHMVRNLVGALVYVGSGREPPESIATLLAGRDRRLAPPTFGPDGLYLAGIDYDPAFGLPAFRPQLSIHPAP
jgi:tRNA pseudouridine38-40 synthase